MPYALFAFVFFLFFCSPSLAAEAEKSRKLHLWVDQNGVYQITDREPQKPARVIDETSFHNTSEAEVERYKSRQRLIHEKHEEESMRRQAARDLEERRREAQRQLQTERKQVEIERAREDLERAEKYQSRYEDRRRSSNYQPVIDAYDDLKKEQDKEVEQKRRKLMQLENN